MLLLGQLFVAWRGLVIGCYSIFSHWKTTFHGCCTSISQTSVPGIKMSYCKFRDTILRVVEEGSS